MSYSNPDLMQGNRSSNSSSNIMNGNTKDLDGADLRLVPSGENDSDEDSTSLEIRKKGTVPTV